MDIYALSSMLLERIANSMHDRNPHLKGFCFSIYELKIVEDFLQEVFNRNAQDEITVPGTNNKGSENETYNTHK